MTTRKNDASGSPNLYRFGRRHEAPFKLIAFPYGGASYPVFAGWSDLLSPAIELWAVCPPGRGPRLNKASFTELTPMVDAAYDWVSPLLDTEYFFLGHSLGSLVAFELTRKIRRGGGRLPNRLFVSGASSPDRIDPPKTSHLPEREFKERLKEINGTPPEILDHAELMDLLLPALRADFQILENYDYRPEPPLECPITAFGGTNDPEVSVADVQAWTKETNGRFQAQIYDGDHFFIHEHYAEMIKIINRSLPPDLL